MNTSLIFDFIQNADTREVEEIIHVEDQIEMNPKTNNIEVYYTLYQVKFKDVEEVEYYISTTSSGANVINKAEDGFFKEVFPEFYSERFGDKKTADDNSTV